VAGDEQDDAEPDIGQPVEPVQQPGSLVATACFFGFAIAVSFALTLLRGWG